MVLDVHPDLVVAHMGLCDVEREGLVPLRGGVVVDDGGLRLFGGSMLHLDLDIGSRPLAGDSDTRISGLYRSAGAFSAWEAPEKRAQGNANNKSAAAATTTTAANS
eukprot:EG_transcript_6584